MDYSEILKLKEEKILSSNTLIENLNKVKLEEFLLSSGSKSIDSVLQGGFRSGTVYVVFGGNSTGKTQLCHQLCVQLFKHSLNEQSKRPMKQNLNIFYLDCENSFRPERLKEFSRDLNHEFQEVLKSITVSNVMSNSVLLLSLEELENRIGKKKVGLLIVDSINNFFRSELGSKEDSISKVNAVFMKILNTINAITKKFNLITILTAQITPNFNENAIIRELPVGHRYLNHFFSEFLYLRVIEKGRFCAYLINSSRFPEKFEIYKLGINGLEDL